MKNLCTNEQEIKRCNNSIRKYEIFKDVGKLYYTTLFCNIQRNAKTVHVTDEIFRLHHRICIIGNFNVSFDGIL
jgi:hypothetical protein